MAEQYVIVEELENGLEVAVSEELLSDLQAMVKYELKVDKKKPKTTSRAKRLRHLTEEIDEVMSYGLY